MMRKSYIEVAGTFYNSAKEVELKESKLLDLHLPIIGLNINFVLPNKVKVAIYLPDEFEGTCRFVRNSNIILHAWGADGSDLYSYEKLHINKLWDKIDELRSLYSIPKFDMGDNVVLKASPIPRSVCEMKYKDDEWFYRLTCSKQCGMSFSDVDASCKLSPVWHPEESLEATDLIAEPNYLD